jgi:hypothetical protein
MLKELAYRLASDAARLGGQLPAYYEPAIAAGSAGQYWAGGKAWATLNQAAVAGLTTTSSPVFVTVNATTGINTGAGAGTQRIDANGNLTNIAAITASGAINTTAGSFQIAGTDAITSARRGVFSGIESAYDLKFTSVAAPTAPTIASIGAGGAVNDGAHLYKITFVTANGETELGTASATATTTTGNNTVNLSAVPTGPAGVTSRKIYRTKAGAASYFLLATLADNTTTTYADTTADASLGATDCTYKDNTTSGKIWRNAVASGLLGAHSTFWGYNAGSTYAAGLGNTFFGALTGGYNGAGLTGNYNSAFGYSALKNVTSGSGNFAMGVNSLIALTTGTYNIAIGGNTLTKITGTAFNIAIGESAMGNTGTGVDNTIAFGYSAGYSMTTDNNVFIGHQSGYTDGTNATTTNLTNATAIGYMAQVQQANSCILGGVGANAQDLGVTTMTPKAKIHGVGDLSMTGGIYTGGDAGTKGTLRISSSGDGELNSAQITGNRTFTTGAGIELTYATIGYISCYDRNASAYKALEFYTGGVKFANATVNIVNKLQMNGSDTIDASRNGTFANVTATALIEPTATTPASAAATGTKGTIVWDTSYVYVCVDTNTWKRAAIATW